MTVGLNCVKILVVTGNSTTFATDNWHRVVSSVVSTSEAPAYQLHSGVITVSCIEEHLRQMPVPAAMVELVDTRDLKSLGQ